MKSTRTLHAALRGETRGQALVEFSMVVLLLILIIVGVSDLGRAVFYSNSLSAAAREAARQAMICGSGPGVTDCTAQDLATKNYIVGVAAGVPLTTSNITISPSSRSFGTVVTVAISVDYTPITPLLTSIVGGPITLRAQSQMMVQ